MAVDTLYYEDFEEGREFVTAEKTVSAEEIVAFAAEFDPQRCISMKRPARPAFLAGSLVPDGT